MNKTILAGLCLLFIAAVNGATFSINSISTCTNQTASGFCMRWEQNGSVVETTSCFPGNSEVYVLQDGKQILKTMDTLAKGELVLGFEGDQETYSEVVGWLHNKPEAHGEYLSIETSSGKFMVSSHHNIALSDGSYAFAQELLGKTLHNGQVVHNVQSVTARGIYAPMTRSANFYVKVSGSQKTLAHCFANIRNPEFYQPFVSAIWQGWELFGSSSQGQQIHPAAKWMMNAFSFLMEQ